MDSAISKGRVRAEQAELVCQHLGDHYPGVRELVGHDLDFGGVSRDPSHPSCERGPELSCDGRRDPGLPGAGDASQNGESFGLEGEEVVGDEFLGEQQAIVAQGLGEFLEAAGFGGWKWGGRWRKSLQVVACMIGSSVADTLAAHQIAVEEVLQAALKGVANRRL